MLLFFFKHKTAYEMRISDWSSDVCSSDLLLRDAGELLALDALDLGGGKGGVLDHIREQIERRRQIRARRVDADIGAIRIRAGRNVGTEPPLRFGELAGTQGLGALVHHPQIGRASCRASVCPYV